MAKTEHKLVDELQTQLKATLTEDEHISFKHNDRSTGGISDLSFSYNDRTSWWEVKHASPKLDDYRELQNITARRLAKHSECWYVIYYTGRDGRKTHIVRPSSVGKNGFYTPFLTFEGHNHAAVVAFMIQQHTSARVR
jgi:hypothetical protein